MHLSLSLSRLAAQVRGKLLELGVLDKISPILTEKVKSEDADALKELAIGILANLLSEESVKEMYLERFGVAHLNSLLNASTSEATRSTAMIVVTNLAHQSMFVAQPRARHKIARCTMREPYLIDLLCRCQHS
jgi:hypothetical protein